MAGGQDRRSKPSVTTAETFRTPILGAPPAPPLSPAGSARRTPIPAAKPGKRKYSYAELADSWQAEFPGEFDRFNRADLVKAILAESPEFGEILDHSTAGTEVAAPLPDLDAAAGRTAAKVQYGPQGRVGADPRVPTPDPHTLRTPSYTDMAIEAGLVAVPSLLGGSLGTSAGPLGTAAGLGAGGAAGEVLREGYQNWSGTRDDGVSLPNVALQGGINAIPFAGIAGKGLSALAPELVERVAPSVARVAGSTLEGAMSSATSTAAEAMVRDHRLPTLGEVGTSAMFGAPFGAAIGGGGEILHAIRAGRAVPDPAMVDSHFAGLQDPATRNTSAQAIYDLATAVGARNPAVGAELLQRLTTEVNAVAQQELQQFAGAFVKDFGTRADTLSMDGQASEIEAFLAGLKERGAASQTLQDVDKILGDIRASSSPRPIDQPSEVGWHTPYDPGQPHGPEVDPGQTKGERAFGAAFEQQVTAPPLEGGGAPAMRLDDQRPPWSEGRNPPRLPEQQELGVQPGKPPLHPGPDVGTPPELQMLGVDALPSVQAGKLSREDALMLQWMVGDLREFSYQPSSRMRGMAEQDATAGSYEDDNSVLAQRTVWSPPVAGTPLIKMFDALGVRLTRSQVATQMENLLTGAARRPGKAAVAGQKIARAMTEAWVPNEQRFDWSLISDERLKDVGLKLRRDFQSPSSPLWVHAREGEQPRDLMEKFGAGKMAETPPSGPDARDFAPDELSEARQLVRNASDTDLQKLYEDLTKYGGGLEHLEETGDFGGAMYDVGPGIIAAELERRGLGKYTQRSLVSEGPGSPGRQKIVPDEPPLLDESPGAPAHDRLQAAMGKREALAAEGNMGPEYLAALKEENRIADEIEAGKAASAPALEQPELIPGVRTEERQTPLLMKEEELFSLTPEDATPAALRRKGAAPGLFDDTGAVGAVNKLKKQRTAAQRDVAISHEDFQDLKETVEAAGGEEVAGLLVGDPDGSIRRVILSDNRSPNPSREFEIGADVVARAQHFARSKGWEVLGSFHSQPTGSAEPSKRDLKGNVADFPMMILGVRGKSLRDVRIWQPSGAGSTAPWLEGQVHLGTEAPKPGTAVPTPVASWMVERIPKFAGAPGDSPAMGEYLKTHKAEFATEPWYIRAQQFMEEGNPRLAWLEVQAATVATQRAARQTVEASPLKDAHRDALVARIEQATAAGPQDPVGALFALYDGRTTWVEGVGRIVVAPEIPPALKGKGVSAGPGGILHPGAADIPLPDEQAVVSMTVDALNDVLKDVKGHGILDDPTQNSFTRLNRQIAEQLMLRSPSSWGAMKSWRTAMKRKGVSDREINRQIAAHLTKTASDSGRFLAALSVWKQRNSAEIRSIEGIKGASGEIDDIMIIGAGGRRIGRLGDLAPVDTFKDIVQPTRAWDRAMLLNDLTRSERGTFDLLESSSRAFMLSQWATAARNFWTVNARWGVEMFDEVASAVASTTLARPGRALNHIRKAGDLLRYTPILRPDGWVMPWHARQAQWEQVFNSTAYLASMPAGKERRAGHLLIEGIPEEQAHFLGSTNFGEPTPHGTSKYRVLNAISHPKVQNTLTMFNRAQEFTARSGMYIVNLRDQLRQKGLDPNLLWQLPPADLAAKLGGQDVLQQAVHHSIAGALDYTFSGALIKKGFGKDEFGRPKGAFNAVLADLINKHPMVRAGYPWPKFNLSAAPRFIWDHSGVNAVVESLNQVLLEQTGGGIGTTHTRFALGKKAAALEGELIPELTGKFQDAQAELGGQLQTVQALSREFSIRKRMIARLERKGLGEAAAAERPNLATLESALQREMQTYEQVEDRMKGLTAQIGAEQGIVDQAKAVRAPESYAELWGRAGAGVATMLVPALLLRAEQQDKGTKWYELRYDVPGLGDTTIDTRPFAPFTQFLFFADVINDLEANTDWAGVSEDLAAGHEMSSAMYGRYEGKYTNKTLGQQALQAFISMSQAAGTTLAILGQFTDIGEQGFPGLEDLGNTTMAALGSFLARFTIPFAQLKGLTDMVDSSESHARITNTDQGMMAPLAQPLGNLPFIGAAVIPETYNQLTGQPLDAYMPGLRASLGVTLRQWERVGGEINATGTPGSAVYIRSTHDPFLDRLIGFAYSKAIAQYADPLIFANEVYLALDSPATRRDYLQAHVFPVLKKIALGQAMLDVGWGRMREERESPEQRRRRLRTDRLMGLAKEEGISFEENGADEPDASPESEPDADEPQEQEPAAAPPSGPPAPRSPEGLQGRAAPQFEDDRETPAPVPAFDRVLAPAFAG